MSSSLTRENLEFVESLSLTRPLSVRPKWFKSTNTVKENDAIVLAILLHIYPAIQQAVKCRINPNTTHKWSVVMGRDEDELGDLRRYYPDKKLPSAVRKAVRQAWEVILRRQKEQQRQRKTQKQREKRAAEKAQREAEKANSTNVSTQISVCPQEKAGVVDDDRAAGLEDLPFADSEQAELFADLKQVQRYQLEELREQQAAEIGRLRNDHAEEERRMIANHHKELAELLVPPDPAHKLLSPPPSSPGPSSVHSSDAGPSRPSKKSQRCQDLLEQIDWEVIRHTPKPAKRKADRDMNSLKGKKPKVEIADDIIELSD
ncbi:hypothetical protein K435DRAFT_864629 [Dendrothele bispora CBS 962.96]|uniref:Uncharacterized protein n=1 Tax=Dendrothele bispora (strain CBS 962.96) TaxID=1314807 RepID=A0A4S8LMW5_DENBC|nr:hypothetical protein K435DRAFT_864629 [Dendrothele bispora CBS 962.96]